MALESEDPRSSALAATIAAAASIAFQVGSKATRDALFLASFGAGALPMMMMATALTAIGFALLSSRALSVWGPARVIPASYAASAGLILLEWVVSLWSPAVAAVLVYLHCGCLGGLLVSGFWSLVNERFDPRTAKRQLGPISAWGTLGGALGGALAARVGATLPAVAMLPFLALFHLIAALSVGRLGSAVERLRRRPASAEGARPGLRTVSRSAYLRGLVLLVLLVTIAEGWIDLVFKSRVSQAMQDPGELLRFFALFYAGLSLLTLLVQSALSRVALERLGPAPTTALLPAGAGLAAAGALAIPGLPSGAVARGAESVLTNSLFRGGYETLFTPVSAAEKRAVKPLADVGAARVGDLIAAGAAQAVLAATALGGASILLGLAVVASILAVWIAMRLNAGYVRSLERGLRSRAIELDLSEVRDGLTRSILLRTLGPFDRSRIRPAASGPPGVPERMRQLGEDDTAREAIEALRKTGPHVIEPLIAGLLDPAQEFSVRRRIPLVLAAYPDPRVVQGLARGLSDRRFEVRYRCGRALSRITELEPSLRVAPEIVRDAVLREVEVGADVWEGRRVLDRMDDEAWSPVMDEAIRERADRSLEHVFTLLALVLPRQPLRIAFRGIHATDPFLRGTALEYLESTLPPEIRRALWPYLEEPGTARAKTARPPEEALARLLSQNESIHIHLNELIGKERPRR